MLLPKKLTKGSKVNLIHTSSPVDKDDWNDFIFAKGKINQIFPNLNFLDVQRTELDPRYLSGSEDERLKKFRQAIKEVDWLAPIYGGTGCIDIVRRLNDEDLDKFRKNRPIVNGFSDTTSLINYLYFKLKLLTFHFENAAGLFDTKNSKLFFDIIFGKKNSFSFLENNYKWLPPANAPRDKIEGIAIGGNFTTFRNLLDICDLKTRSWEDYILFIEEYDMDMEDSHPDIIALDQKGIFKHIKAIVLGRIAEPEFKNDLQKLNYIFGRQKEQEKMSSVFEYLISDTIKERLAKNDPLYILKVDNFGHNIMRNIMIVPIGGKTIIHPDKRIEFVGPFVA
jgi:muramoyltetrapeptide carboxypeptidase LdcA involved in peptidoglycan recycling